MNVRMWAVFVVGLCIGRGASGDFPDFGYEPPSGWTGPMFELSQQYPIQPPSAEVIPWAAIDFRSQPREYMEAVIAYCFDGNIDVDFAGQNNTVRKWYHAPWLHRGNNDREFVHGLTRERKSHKFELAAAQTLEARNFAVGLYNPSGGYAIGRVWSDPDHPNVAMATFPEGTVTFKLLFSTATDSQVPYMVGSPEWIADIDRSSNPSTIENTKVRLLQIDIAVRDARSSVGGWVFGTFHYDTAIQRESPWKRVRPLTLQWGNDPTLTPTSAMMGQTPQESWINQDSPIVQYRTAPPAGTTPPRVLGWAGRGNGPVDNPISSCVSCHSTAQWPRSSPMIPPESLSETEKLRWFRNLGPGEPFDATSNTLDFSLQLSVGIQNFEDFHEEIRNRGGFRAASMRSRGMAAEAGRRSTDEKGRPTFQYRVSRDPEDENLNRRGAKVMPK